MALCPCFYPSIEVVYQPLGVVVGITPWNFPLVICILKLASPIIFGNTVVVKVRRCMFLHTQTLLGGEP